MEFIKQKTTEDDVIGEDTALFDEFAVLSLDCIQLNENEVFIVVLRSNKIICILCSINNTEITIDKTTEISLVSNAVASDRKPSLIKVTNNKVFIFYIGRNGSNYEYKSILCTINETEITAGEAITLVATSYAYYIKAIDLSNNKIILFYSNTSRRLVARIVTINEDMSLTLKDEIISDILPFEYSTSFCKLSNDKIMVIYANSDELTGIICKINNSTITFGTGTQLSSTKGSYKGNSIAQISDNKVVIAHSSNSVAAPNLTITLCSIEDTKITVLFYQQAKNIYLNSYTNTASSKDHYT